MLLIADPQLVDPHTYPDRPWPLSSLTIVYTDLYLRRAYRSLQQSLLPDSTLFLGDLFDGGREWGTAQYESPEDRFKSYGQAFWRREYIRFSKLFLRDWFNGPVATPSAPYGRKIIASVPGNHDLGFASGINPAVKSRFDAFFGPLNRVDVLGNHSFVSLDTVSLSAMDQVDPNTGAHGGGDASDAATSSSHLWKPVEDFLGSVKQVRHRAVQTEWQRLTASPEQRLHKADVLSVKEPLDSAPFARPRHDIPSSQFPTLILSHVPLYRPADTPCGPLREGNPSISLSRGYQYQNVLTPLISSDIVKHLTPEEIVQIYSGDDHDYCEVSHSEYTGAINEITVKSMSWAMGIRKPGVQLVSLWNPIDIDEMQHDTLDNPDPPPTPKDTVQNRLCHLPDQLSIFIRYGQLLILTLIVLAISTFRSQNPPADYEKSEPLLPLTHPTADEHKGRSRTSSIHHPNGSAETSSRKLGGYDNLPATPRSASPAKSMRPDDPFAPAPHTLLSNVESDDWGRPKLRRRRQQPQARLAMFGRSLLDVAWPVLLWYGWFMWRDRA